MDMDHIFCFRSCVFMKHSKLFNRINLGSGQQGLGTWVNVDIGTKYKVYYLLPLFRVLSRLNLLDDKLVSWIAETGRPPPNWKTWDLRKPLPLEPNTMDFVYCSEVIEHYPMFEARHVIQEANRILKKGGVFRITTPDVKKICRGYVEGLLTCREFNEFFFWHSQDRRPRKLERLGELIYSTNPHMFLYDLGSIQRILLDSGFSMVREYSMGVGTVPDLNKLEENMDKRRRFSMYIEASK